jgi:hypothetical protein
MKRALPARVWADLRGYERGPPAAAYSPNNRINRRKWPVRARRSARAFDGA